MTTPAPSLSDQAWFLRYLRDRTKLRGGAQSSKAWLLLEAADVEALERIIDRLDRMAPHENEIRRIVTRGRRG